MILDEYSTFGKNLDVAGSGATQEGTVVDLGPEPRDIGVAGVGAYFTITVQVAIAGGDATFSPISDTVDPPVPAGSKKHGSVVVPNGSPAGYRVAMKLPQGELYDRYLGLEVDRSAALTGQVDASITIDAPAWRDYPDGQN